MPNFDSQKFKIDSQRTETDSQWPKIRKLSISVDTEGGCEEKVKISQFLIKISKVFKNSIENYYAKYVSKTIKIPYLIH